MTRSFSYSFDDLPLVIENSIESGLVAGCAEISYSRDGEWGVEGISFDGYRKATEAELAARCSKYIHQAVSLDRGTPIFQIIYDRLENEWRGKVQDAVAEQIESDRECAADDRADARRDAMLLGDM